MDTLYVTWTMDCEAVQPESTATGGPEDWTLSERAMRGYVEALAAHGHKVTLFLTPRVAEKQAGLALELAAAGAELGMHLHPQTVDFGFSDHLGKLPALVQRNLLRGARDRITRAVGHSPTSFRPGCFSSTADTFDLLVELGFRQGSVTLPGRNIPDLAALWADALPFANRPTPDFLELPTAAALDDLGHAGDKVFDPRHLRIERDGIGDWGPELVSRYVSRQVGLDLPLKALVVMTHNTRFYDDPNDTYRQNLEALVRTIAAAAREAGLAVQGATLAEVNSLSV